MFEFILGFATGVLVIALYWDWTVRQIKKKLVSQMTSTHATVQLPNSRPRGRPKRGVAQ